MRSFIAFSLAVAALSGTTVAAPADTVRYSWKPGEKYTYLVRLQARETNYVDMLQGRLSYTPTAQGDHYRVSTLGDLESKQTDKDGNPLDTAQPSRLAHLGFGAALDREAISLDGQGQAPAGSTGKTPFALADPARLLIDPLPAGAPGTWETDGDCSIFLQPLGKAGAAPTALPAHEHATYTLVTDDGENAVIKKHYELKTKESVNGTPRLQLTGDGQITFDRRQGVPRTTEFNGTLSNPSSHGTETIPVTITTRLMEKPLAPPRPGVPTLTDQERESLLLDLESPDHGKRTGAARRLQAVNADEDATEVNDALLPLLSDPDLFARWGAVDAFKVWATADSIPALIKALTDPEHAVRWADLDALAVLKDDRAAKPLAARLDSPDGGFAEGALKKFGRGAEDAVIPYLQNPNWQVRLAACHVLGEIGTTKSLKPLEQAGTAEKGLVQMAAGDAWKAIRAR